MIKYHFSDKINETETCEEKKRGWGAEEKKIRQNLKKRQEKKIREVMGPGAKFEVLRADAPKPP